MQVGAGAGSAADDAGAVLRLVVVLRLLALMLFALILLSRRRCA